MAVVATGMHLASVIGAVRELIVFLEWQCIHVGTQADRFRAGAESQGAHHAGFTQAAFYGDSPFGQLARDDVRGADFFVAKLWVGVQVAPDILDFAVESDNAIDKIHGGRANAWMAP